MTAAERWVPSGSCSETCSVLGVDPPRCCKVLGSAAASLFATPVARRTPSTQDPPAAASLPSPPLTKPPRAVVPQRFPSMWAMMPLLRMTGFAGYRGRSPGVSGSESHHMRLPQASHGVPTAPEFEVCPRALSATHTPTLCTPASCASATPVSQINQLRPRLPQG